MRKKVKVEELKSGDVIWNENSKFDTEEVSIHPNMYLDGKGFTMTSSKDRYNDRIEYTKNDVDDNQVLGTMYYGKYVTKYSNKLENTEYSLIFSMKRNFVVKFKNWLKTGKYK